MNSAVLGLVLNKMLYFTILYISQYTNIHTYGFDFLSLDYSTFLFTKIRN